MASVGGEADAVPSGFDSPDTVYSGLAFPTNVEFAPNGRVFVTEIDGLLKSAPTVDSPLTTFADLRSRVHHFWDRGLLGLAVHPNFPAQPYVYVLYAYGTPLSVPGGPTHVWEAGGVNGDGCPDPPGALDDGCVVSARLSRLVTNAAGTAWTGEEQILITDWCQQFPSHSIGDVEFGPDGMLYVSGGDGASFTVLDYGQWGGTPGSPTPKNPCGDAPGGAGASLAPPSAEGGALRAQDLRTSGDAVGLSGAIIRVDPVSGAAAPGNPGPGSGNSDRIIAYGMRNPFRFAIRPGTDDLYIGDVGSGTWEELNVHPNPTGAVRNFGWPCYEGGNGVSAPFPLYDGTNLTICEDLYDAPAGTTSASLFAYRHDEDISGDDECPPAPPGPMNPTSSSITGLAFYTGGPFPDAYDGALFGADYSRHCFWVMFPGAGGAPDPSTVEVFHYEPSTGPATPGVSPVDLEMGPGGDLYYVSFLRGQVGRFRFDAPIAAISANPPSGMAPLLVNLSASGSGGTGLSYSWDLDNDGQFDDATGVNAQQTFAPGNHMVRLRVVDSSGRSDTASTQINVSNDPPTPTINTPGASTLWSVGQQISFSGSATDPQEGALAASRLTWNLILHHCEDDGLCHEHPLQTFNGVSGGSFSAPDHPYPSHLELRLTARDQFGASTTVGRELDPRTVQLTFRTNPNGLDLAFAGEVRGTPFTETVIVGSANSVSALCPENGGGPNLGFASWADGGAFSRTITAPTANTTYTANYAPASAPCQGDGFGVVDVTTGKWYLRNPTDGQTTSFFYGVPGDIPMMGDWDCDGDDTPGLYRQSNGFVYLRNSNTQGVGQITYFFGVAGDIPLAGDFDGDGCDTVSIYRPTEGRVYVINELGTAFADFAYFFGVPGDKPFAGDFDFDGIDEIGLHRESTGFVYFRFTHTSGVANQSFFFGIAGDRIIAGRWAQIGSPGPDTVGIFRPSIGTFFLRFSNSQGFADFTLPYGNAVMRPVAGSFGALPGGSPPPP
jgi:glucose/arabinose dehydrogenase